MTLMVSDTGGQVISYCTSSREMSNMYRVSFDGNNTKQNSFLLAGILFPLVCCLRHVVSSLRLMFLPVLHTVPLMNTVDLFI